jgi:DNA invertase Pin-like site-specific DNA recombinase
MQVARCLDYCRAQGFSVLDTIIEAGLSAKDIDHRPGLQRILTLANHRRIAHVVCLKLDRLTRNTCNALLLASFFGKKSVELHIVQENGHLKTDSAEDEFLLTLKAGLATRERRVIAERTRQAMQRKRERQEYCGGESSYGYRAEDGKLTPDDHEQAIIRTVRKWRNQGMSIRRIVARLADLGYRNRKGNPFAKTAIERILKSE